MSVPPIFSLPDDPELWAALPGVGRYILGAVLSQAFDRPMPIVEANTLRLLCRLFAYEDDPRSAAGQKWLWEKAGLLVPKTRPGDFNQAMMELGSLVCTPKSPDCPNCPVQQYCESYQRGLQDRIPLVPVRKAAVEVAEVAIVIRKRGKLLFCRRSSSASRWANLWEFPHAELQPGEDPGIIPARRIARAFTGYKILKIEPLTRVRHAVTHHMIVMSVVTADWVEGTFQSPLYDCARWLKPQELQDYPMSSPQARIVQMLVNSRTRSRTTRTVHSRR